jgi:hypothetical protein
MKTKEKKTAKTFDAVKSMREIRDKISLEIADMNFEQLKVYFKQHRLQKTKLLTSTKKELLQ